MELLKKLNEDAAGGAVGGGAVAAYAAPLFSSPVTRTSPPKQRKSKRKKSLGLQELFTSLSEDTMADSNFDQTEVISKLKSLEKKNKIDRDDSITFGLEDENGDIVRVTVQGDQAEEFEHALQAFLADEEQREGGVPEVAEMLFKLRDRFNILDVAWPQVEEDEEEPQEIGDQPQDDQQFGDQPPPGDQQDPDLSGMLDAGDGNMGQDDESSQSLLSQVINMMKADADARKAEAVARQKEAELRTQRASSLSAKQRVRQEEELLDMDAFFKDKQTADKEAKQLAKLAKWKHEVNDGDDDFYESYGIPFDDDDYHIDNERNSMHDEYDIDRDVDHEYADDEFDERRLDRGYDDQDDDEFDDDDQEFDDDISDDEQPDDEELPPRFVRHEEEQEETSKPRKKDTSSKVLRGQGRMHPAQLADFILGRIK